VTLIPVVQDEAHAVKPRIGAIVPPVMKSALRKGLAELGHVEYRSIYIDWRDPTTEGQRSQFAAELARSGVDVIVTAGTPAAKAAMAATSTIPVVCVEDALAAGLVVSLARPDTNGTGISIQAPDLSIRQLELLHRLAPGARRFAFLGGTTTLANVKMIDDLQKSAASIGVQMEVFDAATPEQIDVALRSITKTAVEALIVSPELAQLDHKTRIVEAVNEARLPAVYSWREYHHVGAVMSYGFRADHCMRRAAYYVDRLLKGEQANELAVEPMSDYHLGIDLRQARALNIEVPKDLRLRADEVYQ
jgi:putative ABC transport system substrate-binding protein